MFRQVLRSPDITTEIERIHLANGRPDGFTGGWVIARYFVLVSVFK